MSESAASHRLLVLGYCLMPNHTHCIVVPLEHDAMARTFADIHSRHGQLVNLRSERHGHFWQDRYFSCVLDEPHLLMAARYIERNPVRAGLVTQPEEWSWSSARAHCGREESPMPLMELFKYIDSDPERWHDFINEPDCKKFAKRLTEHTLHGYALGSAVFVERLEMELGCSLRPGKRGRPAGNKDNAQ